MQTFSDIAKKYVWALNGLIGKHKNKRNLRYILYGYDLITVDA